MGKQPYGYIIRLDQHRICPQAKKQNKKSDSEDGEWPRLWAVTDSVLCLLTRSFLSTTWLEETLHSKFTKGKKIRERFDCLVFKAKVNREGQNESLHTPSKKSDARCPRSALREFFVADEAQSTN